LGKHVPGKKKKSQRTNLKIIPCFVGRMWWKMVNALRLKEAAETGRDKTSL